MSSSGPEFAHLTLTHGLRAEVVDQIAGLARLRRFGAGGRIFNQGDEDVRAHVLLSGAVRITQAGADGAQVLLRFIKAGDMFGAVSIFTDRRYPGDATAVSDTVEASWTDAELLQFIERWPRVGVNIIRIVGRRLQEAQNRVRELSTQRTEQRIANALLRLADQVGVSTADGLLITLPLRRRDIADLAGTTLYTASRLLTAWEKEGLLQTSKSGLRLHLPAGLESRARRSR